MHITERSRHYSLEVLAEIHACGADHLTELAAGWREIAADPEIGKLRDWAVAAYFQSVADRKRAAAR